MTSNDAVMHVSIDKETMEALKEVGAEIRALREEVKSLHSRVDRLHNELCEVRGGLDAWAGRIQRLEALPGVSEAIKASGFVNQTGIW